MSAPTAAAPPQPIVLDGRYTRLEPISVAHAADLFDAAVPDRFEYLSQVPPADAAEVSSWIAGVAGSSERMYFAVIDKATGRAEGRFALMGIVPEHGVIEFGGIYWGPRIARTRIATEALHVTARHIFEDLGYRRFEWKCNDRNEPSKRAAQRFGFTYEGLFRQHMIMKGENRDTAWFSMLDGEWPERKAEFDRWLDPSNFDADGQQKTALRFG
jgi:RimJ/RimL family protein N-acetyltransferase